MVPNYIILRNNVFENIILEIRKKMQKECIVAYTPWKILQEYHPMMFQ